jgi:hypothetical protein
MLAVPCTLVRGEHGHLVAGSGLVVAQRLDNGGWPAALACQAGYDMKNAHGKRARFFCTRDNERPVTALVSQLPK